MEERHNLVAMGWDWPEQLASTWPKSVVYQGVTLGRRGQIQTAPVLHSPLGPRRAEAALEYPKPGTRRWGRKDRLFYLGRNDAPAAPAQYNGGRLAAA